ncbi:MAG: 4'-phosphopantetheinyl transferase superfamily protein [Rhodobacter sp.]|nr:4'-phosphopantetheinyl transferase superfamily protein [Rhodobacter sp.]
MAVERALSGARLVTFRLDSDADIALAAAERLLSDDETARAARFHFDRDRHRYIRARGVLRRVLGEATDQPPEALCFDYGPRGKPRLAVGPAFNLSHSGDHGAVALAETGRVGLDIEARDRRITDRAALAERCFSDPERAAIDAAPDPLHRFLSFWTAKEARMKLTGEGLALDPRDIHLTLDEDGRPTGIAAPDRPATTLTRFEEDGIIGALALASA